MGHSQPADGAQPRVRLHASSNAWIEGAAVAQLEHLATRPGIVAVVGLPDLHPGHHGPVGCAALAEGRVHPDVIGADIGCGMRFHVLDLPERRLKLDKAVERLAALEGPWNGDAEGLIAMHGIEGPASELAAALGTVGGGNHFCELQGVQEIVDAGAADRIGLARGALALLVHSGSRGLGAAVLARHRRDGTAGLALAEEGEAYLAEHDNAVRFARLNRQVIAARACAALRAEAVAAIDSPHNLAERHGDRVLHRKGAAPADRGLVPVPGSRGAVTFVVEPCASADALGSLAHGAGRKHDRPSMHQRISAKAGSIARQERNPFGGHVICTDRRLLLEEAPEAYKDIVRVVDEMVDAGLCRVVAVMRPVITFKSARPKAEDAPRRRDRRRREVRS